MSEAISYIYGILFDWFYDILKHIKNNKGNFLVFIAYNWNFLYSIPLNPMINMESPNKYNTTKLG